MAKKKSELTADNLKQSLWETLQKLREKKIDPSLANAVASQSREIMRVVNAEIRLAEVTGSTLTSFMGAKAAPKRIAK